MAQDRSEIVIKVRDTVGENTGASSNKKSTSSIVRWLNNPLKQLTALMFGDQAGAFAYQIANQVVSTSLDLVEYSYNTSLSLSANYVAKREIELTTNIIKGSTGLIKSAISGAITGSALGPVGAVVGALTSVGSNAINGIISSNKAYQQQMINVVNNNTQTAFMQNRYNGTTTDFSRGTEN